MKKPKKYTLGNVTFGTFLAKEHYVTKGHIHSLEYIMSTVGKHMCTSEHQLLKLTIKNLKTQEKRMAKQIAEETT